jgi:TrmH family RNA methyltransferase
MKALGAERRYRREYGEFLCDGLRCLKEAAETDSVTAVLAVSEAPELAGLPVTYVAREILEYVAPVRNVSDFVFSCKIPETAAELSPGGRYIILDGVADPGNVGSVIRTAAAFGLSAVALTGDCADTYNPKTVRASMGGIFKIPVIPVGTEELRRAVGLGLTVYGAALSDAAADVRSLDFAGASAAIGSEGAGLSAEVLALCEKLAVIPMCAGTESLNAAAAAAILMWEMRRG